MTKSDDVLIYAHIGDLHLTEPDAQNALDLRDIVSDLAGFGTTLDFVYVPGDNADNGLPEQYALARRELARLPTPVHIITGDHDMEQGTLDNFYGSLGAEPLPKAIDVAGVRCLFLDICGPGSGGPDFRIGRTQKTWLDHELETATRAGTRCVIFMHSYPADLRGDGETDVINAAFEAREVLLVDMGHTHYNELANDGRTIFAATRSTGQIEEGPVGYSLVTVDGRVVSWRFRLLGDRRPAVLITSPADRRLATDSNDPTHRPLDACDVRVSVLHARPITRCDVRVDSGSRVPMTPNADGRFVATVPLAGHASTITVDAVDDLGLIGSETIELARDEHPATQRTADGSDADAIDAWPERGIPGGQLGPNRNGKKW